MERFTLLLNHVLASEPVAVQKLQPHVGKALSVELSGWPGWLPPPPPLAWAITPAGLLEWRAAAGEAARDLHLRIDMADPAAVLASALQSRPPPAAIEGEAQLAADVGWLMQNLRWDLAADLERLLPAGVVQPLLLAGRSIRSALQRLAATVRPPPGTSGR